MLSDISSSAIRSGTGAYEYEIPSRRSLLASGTSVAHAEVRQCNWSRPVRTNLPDAPSRTCGGRLPSGHGIGLLGNQGGAGRDPLTFLTSPDGLDYKKHWIVQSDAPPPKWAGDHGYNYPSFVWCTDGCSGPAGSPVVKDKIIFSYGLNKEDIVLTIAPLASLGL